MRGNTSKSWSVLMTASHKQAPVNFWDRDRRIIGPGHYGERLQDVRNQWQLFLFAATDSFAPDVSTF